MYRVEADYVTSRASGAIGPGAFCYSLKDARELASEWEQRSDLFNVVITPTKLGLSQASH